MNNVEPCKGLQQGALAHAPCPDCGHVYMVHSLDGKCGLCDAIQELKR